MKVRFIPENSKKIEDIDTKIEIYVYGDGLKAIAYKGRANKPKWHLRFQSVERTESYVNAYLADEKRFKHEKDEANAKRKVEKTQQAGAVKVGDIFTASWGWEQTNVDAYQVVEKKGMTVTLRKIGLETVPGSEGHDCDRVIPVKDKFLNDKEIKKRLNGDSIKFASYMYAYLYTEGKTLYRSWYY